jgi:hypothetical protein
MGEGRKSFPTKLKPMKKSEFLEDVAHEINALMENATKEELNRLNIFDFNPTDIDNCIYGQMTGSCESMRAKDLMDTSCIKVFDIKGGHDIEGRTFTNVKSQINGANTGQTWGVVGQLRTYRYLSALEGYIQLKGAKNSHIINYMKGKVETLKL